MTKRNPILKKDIIEEKLEEIVEETDKDGEIPENDRIPATKNPFINNNGCEKNCAEVDGFFWHYKEMYFFNKAYGLEGFDKNEVKQIASQIEKICKECSKKAKDEYALVKCDNQSFYVHIDDAGIVFLPELVGSVQDGTYRSKLYGKTNNLKKILGFNS